MLEGKHGSQQKALARSVPQEGISEMDLPVELLEQYQKSRVLVFIGQGINGQEWSRLGEELAHHLDEENLKDGTASTAELAELFDSVHGSQALVQTVLDFYGRAAGVQRVHSLLSRLTKCRHYVTTCVDPRLEEAFRDAGRKLSPIVRHSDLPYGAADAARLYYLYGTVNQPETLRLTQEQTADVLSAMEDDSLSDILKGYLADNTIVFVGFNLDDDFFKQLYRNTIKSLHRHQLRSYAFTQHNYREVTRRFCERNNIQVITAGLDDLLSSFVEALEKYGVPEVQDTAVPVRKERIVPYKRLLSYQPEDRSIFFGREEESEQLLALVRANQLMILYGASGSGKSSLVGAGLIPLLKEDHYQVWSERILDSPLDVLYRYKDLLPGSSGNGSLVSLLERASQDQPLVIILDQFEEFFTRVDALERAAFIQELRQVLARRDLPVKWVLAFRSEALAQLNELKPSIPGIFKAELYLPPLGRKAAEDAICRPAALAGLQVETELQNAILADLEQEGRVSPPQLQIICHDLYQAALSKQDNTLRLEHYRERGGAQEILGSYLENVLQRLPLQAKQVLVALVSGDGAPVMLTAELVAQAAKLPIEETANLLAQLEDEWLVKTVMVEGRPYYELAHAYLIASLAVDPEVMQRKAIEELLLRGVLDWKRHRVLMSQEELRTIRNWADRIDLSADAQDLLLRSAVQRNFDLPYWLEKFGEANATPILKEFLNGSETIQPQPEVALAALASLSRRHPYQDDLQRLLGQPSLSFDARKQAAMYLAEMDPSLALNTLRTSDNALKRESSRVITELYNAEAIGQLKLGVPPSWKERSAYLTNRLRNNFLYILARTGSAGFAASVGGLLGSIAGISLIQGAYLFYLFGAAFVPFVWAIGLIFVLNLTMYLRMNQKFSTYLTGAILGNLPLALLAATDPDSAAAAREGLIFGLLGAVLSGLILAVTLYYAGRARTGVRIGLSTAGAALAGVAYSFVLLPLVSTTEIPGFNAWSLIGILTGGAAAMMLGVSMVPTPRFVGVNFEKN